MIKITINKKSYKGPYRWEDITLQKFTELAAIPMPEGYEAFILADANFDSEKMQEYLDVVANITDQQLNEEFPAYYKKVIRCLTNIPDEVIELLDTEKINELYEYYLKPFVVSLLYHFPVLRFMGNITRWEPQQIRQFKIRFTSYYVPETVSILDQVIPFSKEPIITYSEASDLFRGNRVTKDDVKRLSLFMAIYCRRKNEKYDEGKALQRQRIMMQVPMSTVWSVFFYTVQRLPDYTTAIRLFGSLPKSTREAVQRAITYKSMAVGD
jgi:hypothetical protein